MLLYGELSDKILNAMNTVHGLIGPGFLEAIYEGALEVEFKLRGLEYERQKPYQYYYKKHFVNTYYADMVVEDKVIIELKAVKELERIMEAQLLNYLKLANLKVGYLVNFNSESLQFKRFVL